MSKLDNQLLKIIKNIPLEMSQEILDFAQFLDNKYKKSVVFIDETLKTHKLTGKLNGKYSCSINYEYRIVMIIEIKDNELYLLNIGTHDVVYK